MQDVYGICVNTGIAPAYFLDEISELEVEAIIKQYYNNLKREMENTRFIMFASLAPYSKNLKLTEVLKFDWDNETVAPVKLTEEEREKIKQEGAAILKQLKKMDHGES
ncbi:MULTISPECIES: hypothetical protein [unclassified Carboxylicivirga]|uniref:hypothetical protein n=1 Tax=Carboxylicivirga TaxID=1628153 RepID=UPI003D35532E